MRQFYLQEKESSLLRSKATSIGSVVLAIFLCLVAFGVVLAQENPATQSALPEGEPSAQLEQQGSVFIKPEEDERMLELRILYRDQVEAYRSAERAFVIAKGQFEQVQTLNSLEEAVKATKSVFFERSRVLVTYLELVVLTLQKTQGVELSLKERSLDGLNKVLLEVIEHQKAIEAANTRDEMAVLADSFEVVAQQAQLETYKALSLIRTGSMQSLLDRTLFVKQQIVSKHQSENAAETIVARRERAYAEIDRKLGLVQQSIDSINASVLKGESAQQSSPFSASFYETVLKNLGSAYAQMTQSLNNITELLRL